MVTPPRRRGNALHDPLVIVVDDYEDGVAANDDDR